jgi:hypothetical protein
MYVICYFFADKLLVNARAMLLLQKNYIVFFAPNRWRFYYKKKNILKLNNKRICFFIIKTI